MDGAKAPRAGATRTCSLQSALRKLLLSTAVRPISSAALEFNGPHSVTPYRSGHTQRSTANVDVCRPCGECPKNETWRGFTMPIGTDWLVNTSCAPNEELGHSHKLLPVTHVRDAYSYSVSRGMGIWYYYARGCSDLYWNTGRTLLARNRIHAALLAEARLRGVAVDTPGVIAAFAGKYEAKLGPKKMKFLVGRAAPELSHLENGLWYLPNNDVSCCVGHEGCKTHHAPEACSAAALLHWGPLVDITRVAPVETH